MSERGGLVRRLQRIDGLHRAGDATIRRIIEETADAVNDMISDVAPYEPDDWEARIAGMFDVEEWLRGEARRRGGRATEGET